MSDSSDMEKSRWERNERVRRLALERDRERPPAELLAETIELSRVSMRLAASARAARPRDLRDLEDLGVDDGGKAQGTRR